MTPLDNKNDATSPTEGATGYCGRSLKENLTKVAALIVTLWTSRKLWMTIFGVSILYGLYWHSAFHMTQLSSTMEAEKLAIIIPVLNEMYQTVMWGVVTAIGVLLGFSTLDKFTRTTSSVATIASRMINENITSRQDIVITEKYDPTVEEEFSRRYAEDESYRPPGTTPEPKRGWIRPT